MTDSLFQISASFALQINRARLIAALAMSTSHFYATCRSSCASGGRLLAGDCDASCVSIHAFTALPASVLRQHLTLS